MEDDRFLSDWRKHGSVLVRFNSRKNGWEVKVNGKILKSVFINERAAVRFGKTEAACL